MGELLIPSVKQCFQLIRQMEMMSHIKAHSLMVCQVAELLTDRLTRSDISIRLNRNLVYAGALLHDITKTRSLKTGENHAATGDELLCEMDFPQVGAIIRQHVALDEYFVSATPDEAEIVNYADKRVLNTDIVSLAQRMDYILERYGTNLEYRQRLRRIGKYAEKTEKRIFGLIDITPEQVDSLVEQNRIKHVRSH